MKFSNFVILSALTAQSSSFVVQSPIKRQYTDNGFKRVSGIVITHPRFDPVLNAVGDPSDVVGAAFALSKLPILVAPLVAIAAGLSALNQRDRIRDEIATTETELQSIRKRLESSQMMINTSFGATAVSALFAVVSVFGGAPTQPKLSSLPSTTLASEDSPNQVVSETKTKDLDLGAKPSERSLLPATEGGSKELSTFDSLLQKLETATEKTDTTKSEATESPKIEEKKLGPSKPDGTIEGQQFETPIIGAMIEPKVPQLNIPQKIAALMESKKEDTQEELKLETPKVEESKAAPAKTTTAKVEIPPQEDSSEKATPKMTEAKKEELKLEILKVEEPKATSAKTTDIPVKEEKAVELKKEETKEDLTKLDALKVEANKIAESKVSSLKDEKSTIESVKESTREEDLKSDVVKDAPSRLEMMIIEKLKGEEKKVEAPQTEVPKQDDISTSIKVDEPKTATATASVPTRMEAQDSPKEDKSIDDTMKAAGKAIEERIPFFGVKEETPKMDLLKLDPVKEPMKEPAKESAIPLPDLLKKDKIENIDMKLEVLDRKQSGDALKLKEVEKEKEVVPMKTESVKDPLEEIKQIATPLKIGGTSENEDTQSSIAKTMVSLFDRASAPSLVPSGDATSQDAEIDIASIIGVGGIVAAGAIAVFGAITFVGESDPSSDDKNERKQSTMKSDTPSPGSTKDSGVSTKTDMARTTNLVEKVADQRPIITVSDFAQSEKPDQRPIISVSDFAQSEKEPSPFSFAKESMKDIKKIDSRPDTESSIAIPQKSSIQNQLDDNTMISAAPSPSPPSTLSYLETVTSSGPPERKAPFKAAYNPRTASNSPATVGASNSYLESMNASGPPKVKAPFKAMYNPKAAANQQEGNTLPAVSTSYFENVGSSPPVTESISKGSTSSGPEVLGTSKSYLESMNASGPPKVKAPFKAMYNPRAVANQQEGVLPADSTSYLENMGSSPPVTESISKGITSGVPEVVGTSKSYLESMNASGPPKVKAPFKAMYNPRAVVNEPEGNKQPVMPKSFLEAMESFPPISGSARNDIGSSNSYLESMNASGPPKVKAPYKAMYNPRTAANENAESSSTASESLYNDNASVRPEFSDSPKAPIGTGSYLDNL